MMRRHKILFIMNSLDGGGAEKALIELLEHFDYSRYNVSLCLIFYKGIYIDRIPPQVKIMALFQDYCAETYYGAMAKVIKRKKFDVIISFMEGLSLYCHYMISDQAKRNITWVHCDLLKYHWTLNLFQDSQFEEEYYKDMDQIVFVSALAQKSFEQLYKIDVPKCSIYNIVDVDKIRLLSNQEDIPHERFIITTIGSLFEVKAFDRIIRVAKMLKDENHTLLFQIIGSGRTDYKEQLLQLRNELDMENEIRFLGFKSPPYAFLKSSDIFVSTSRSEGFSLVICEALSLGIPVVSTRTSGAIELLGDNEYGLLTDHNDLSIYENIKKLIDNRPLREWYSKQSLKRSEIFNIEQTMQSVYELF